MKLTYWKANHEYDSNCFSIRERTKKAAVAKLSASRNPEDYGPVHKVVIQYTDAFDLMTDCTDETERA